MELSVIISVIMSLTAIIVNITVMVLIFNARRIQKLSDKRLDQIEKRITQAENKHDKLLEKLSDSFVSKSACEKQSIACIGNFEKQFNNGMDQFQDIKATLKDLASDITEIKIQNAKHN